MILMAKIVCDVHANGNVFLGFTMWDVHKNGNVFLGLTVWNVHNKRKRLFGTNCVGCTYDRNQLGLYNRISSLGRCTRPHFVERVCQEGLTPTVSGSCGKDPPIAVTHLATVRNAVAERG